ncbi:MAG: hypothetical protein COB16_11365 [Rhodobacteraceae bacterium]|nr:MAG: hypothetical protein COB16_11365 [Paracoccaceae bacterium]
MCGDGRLKRGGLGGHPLTDHSDLPSFYSLQSLMWPESGICTERDLYLRSKGPVAVSDRGRRVRFASGGLVAFSTWFNLFNGEKWVRECGLEDLSLLLEGAGEFELSVFLASRGKSWDRVVSDIVTFPENGQLRLELSHVLQPPYDPGQLFFELRALGQGALLNASWQTRQAPRRSPDLVLAVTTFRREAEVARTMARFSAFAAQSWMQDHLHMVVVDNGQSVETTANDHVSIIPNANLGGAGGFTRGLLEARGRGASHCLFMDDDASIHMDSLERTYQFLAYATDPGTAVAGAMIGEQHRWAIWENGALFHGGCQPLHMGTDLRDVDEVIDMEASACRPVPWNFYGGWWYFAFPLERAEHLAFPFFVRGDDVSFSLANDFNIVTLNGVVSFQESFTEKESPQTWYLDLRSHMAHHLSLPALDMGRLRVLKIAAWFMLRNLPRMHYDTMAAVNLALEDVMQGPEFFDQNADMAQRRADLKALTKSETWQNIDSTHGLPPIRKTPLSWGGRLLMKLTLNGLLIPFYGRLGRKITLRAKHRGHIGYVWGAAQITVLNAEETKAYTVCHDKWRAVQLCGRFLRNGLRFFKCYETLAMQYRGDYGRLTSETYWRDKLEMAEPSRAAQKVAE